MPHSHPTRTPTMQPRGIFNSMGVLQVSYKHGLQNCTSTIAVDCSGCRVRIIVDTESEERGIINFLPQFSLSHSCFLEKRRDWRFTSTL